VETCQVCLRDLSDKVTVTYITCIYVPPPSPPQTLTPPPSSTSLSPPLPFAQPLHCHVSFPKALNPFKDESQGVSHRRRQLPQLPQLTQLQNQPPQLQHMSAVLQLPLQHQHNQLSQITMVPQLQQQLLQPMQVPLQQLPQLLKQSQLQQLRQNYSGGNTILGQLPRREQHPDRPPKLPQFSQLQMLPEKLSRLSVRKATDACLSSFSSKGPCHEIFHLWFFH
jgi:hypothetical protein